MRSILSLLLLAGLATPALAVDGVLEINQTCAVNSGCFAGDAPGFPVQIDGSSGRSYRLTSDLIVPNVDTHGIQVSSPSIRIDLNGFEIAGSSCAGAGFDCTPASGTGSGVHAPFANINGTSVRNGSITGMGSYGVNLQGPQVEAKGLRVRWNRLAGIFVGNGSIVSGNSATDNGQEGIYVLSSSTVSGNTVFINGSDGIYAGQGSTVIGNTAWGNEDDGIATTSGCAVQGNTVRRNLGYGLRLWPTDAYRENVITDNTVGTVTGGVNAGDNVCNGSLTCP
jgi:hypothetical protein